MRLTLALTLALSAIDQVTAEPADRLIRIRTLDPTPDRGARSRSMRCSAVSTTGVVVNGMRHHMICTSSVQATRF